MNNAYKITKAIDCNIRDAESSYVGWYVGEQLYLISNEEKFGLAYDQKSRCYPIEPPQYDMLLDCIWDYINIINTEYGACVIAYLGGKGKLFHLLGDREIIEENEKNHKNLFYISANQISDHSYESVNYYKHCDEILFLHFEEHMQYYDLRRKRLSDIYDFVGYLDEEFIYCTKNNITNCININDNICFPTIPDGQWAFHCKYEDGRVYYVLTNRDCENNEHEAYLIFYSKKSKTFYSTEIYDEIILYTYSENGKAPYLSAFEGIKNGKRHYYCNSEATGRDIDISKIANLRVVNTRSNRAD